MSSEIKTIKTKQELMQISSNKPIAYVIWCFWYKGLMNGNRKTSFELMKSNLGVPLCLITEENIQEFILPEFPLHPAFPLLSDVHKSDYLRIYLLHHYGGGWHDIKPTKVSFREVWKEFDDSSIFLVGRPEVKGGPAKVFDGERRWMPDFWTELVGCGWWVGRPNTPLSAEMYSDINHLLDKNYEALKKFPAKTAFDKKKEKFWSGLPFFRKRGYPLPWTVFGNIFHPLNYKYRAHVKNILPTDEQYNLGLSYR